MRVLAVAAATLVLLYGEAPDGPEIAGAEFRGPAQQQGLRVHAACGANPDGANAGRVVLPLMPLCAITPLQTEVCRSRRVHVRLVISMVNR